MAGWTTNTKLKIAAKALMFKSVNALTLFKQNPLHTKKMSSF